jgi:hypothetical protein
MEELSVRAMSVLFLEPASYGFQERAAREQKQRTEAGPNHGYKFLVRKSQSVIVSGRCAPTF